LAAQTSALVVLQIACAIVAAIIAMTMIDEPLRRKVPKRILRPFKTDVSDYSQ
jgi:peptidoglycan/LPS O-acetylase OafA/YrhL